jgi:Flp pilus assembly protein TadG
MRAAVMIARLGSTLRALARDRGAVSAVEFAIVLPFMVTLYVGGAELGDGLAIQFKVTETARTVTDLASQFASLDTAEMNAILAASSAIVAPYANNNMAVTVSQVTTNAKGQGTISWSCSLNGTAHASGAAVTLPTGLQTANTSLIWGEVTYPYTPSIGNVITGTITIYQTMYFLPRLSASVTGPTSC